MDSRKLDDALKQLLEERQLLESARADYRHITQSRFYGLRILWSGFKHILGVGATEEPALDESDIDVPRKIQRARSVTEATLYESWRSRITERASSQEPLVTILVPAFNQSKLTIACLASIAKTQVDTLAVQVVLVDDASSDRTSEVASVLDGLDYVRNAQNLGFLRSCNRGASIARGKYICLLNNDTVVRDGWLEALVTLAESDSTVGAVGSKLLYPDGRLQEAGGIIFRDGHAWNYGRGDDSKDARYNYVREVDYCSGAALLVRTDLFNRLGGFDEWYAPAYYEDADLCMGIRSLGYRVLYQPISEVVHAEGSSSGTKLSSGTKRYQEINRPIFAEKWATQLPDHAERGPTSVPSAARRYRAAHTILVVDSYVPMYDKEAGSHRLFAILDILIESGYRVLFLPDNHAAIAPYTAELEQLGVEVLYHSDQGRSVSAHLAEVLPMASFAWICRPELFEKYAPIVRQHSNAKLIYDTIDLHFLRVKRAFELLGEGDPNDWQRFERIEIAAARSTDATITVTERERSVLTSYGIENVHVVPTLHEPTTGLRRFSETSGILFIGGYNHAPNRDAAGWLCREIMPIVWRSLPEVTLTLLGSNPPDEVRALQCDRVRIPGFLPDVTRHFVSSRIFVAPIRFGAGMNGKIGQSLSFGLPVVTTPLGAEGFNLVSGRNCLIAQNAPAIAEAIVHLYSDKTRWDDIRSQTQSAIQPFGRGAVTPRIQHMLATLASEASA